MADNLSVTPGAGATLRADDVGGILYQFVKLDIGGDGVTVPVTTGGTSSDAIPTNPRYYRKRISVTPTISNAAIYAAKDAVGGIMTFANAARSSAGSGVIRAVTVKDLGQQMAALDLILFDQTIGGTVTDNAAFDPLDADLANVIGWVSIAATTGYKDFNDNSVAFAQCEIPYVCNGTSLFGALVARGTPTYTSTADLTVVLTCDLD